MSAIARVVDVFLRGRLSAALIVVSLLAGGLALWLTPREEDPQIVVPLADVFVTAPGLRVEEVERQVSTRLEKLLAQMPEALDLIARSVRAGYAFAAGLQMVGDELPDPIASEVPGREPPRARRPRARRRARARAFVDRRSPRAAREPVR